MNERLYDERLHSCLQRGSCWSHRSIASFIITWRDEVAFKLQFDIFFCEKDPSREGVEVCVSPCLHLHVRDEQAAAGDDYHLSHYACMYRTVEARFLFALI